jgi:signal transduction histidine kinase
MDDLSRRPAPAAERTPTLPAAPDAGARPATALRTGGADRVVSRVGSLPWLSTVAGAAAAVVAAGALVGAGSPAVAAVAVVAAVAGIAAAATRRAPALGAWLVVLAGTQAAAAWVDEAAPVAAAGWLCLGLALPRGRLAGPRSWIAAAGVAGAAAWTVLLVAGAGGPGTTPMAVASVAVAVVFAGAGVLACLRGTAVDRAVLQWTAAGGVLAVALAGVVAAMDALLGVPPDPGATGLGGLALVPAAVAAGTWPSLGRRAATALTEAVVTAGLAVFVGAVYLVVVIGLGRTPADSERGLLGLSLAAAAAVAVLALPVRARLLELTGRLLRQDGESAEQIVTGFGARMTRAVPMDELLLQLAESLRGTLGPAGAEIWVGTGGALSRSVSVPDRGAGTLALASREATVAARTKVAGNGWLTVWAPRLLAGRDGELLRVAPIAHLGDLLGLIVVARPAEHGPYGEDDDRLLADLARQVGLALHNVRLDSALQESLEELRRRNAELAASRARVVAAADESRRRIERDLHDGAQQHLVALAVKIGLAQQVDDPQLAGELLRELRTDVQGAIDALRELAHGIYPPLLRQRGLGDALRNAAGRAALPTEVDVALPGRYPADVEAAVYFCCLEAMQNAGKHAGAGARMAVTVAAEDGTLRFSVRDDGVGFGGAQAHGAGFVNMADRLGAIGGTITVVSAPGEGTTVSGTLPATPIAAPAKA